MKKVERTAGTRRGISLIAFALAAIAAPVARAGEEESQVLLWIRAGALSPAETSPDPEETPRLREMVLDGVTAADQWS